MGYYIEHCGGNITIKEEYFQVAVDGVRALMTKVEEQGSGKVSNGEEVLSSHYSWIRTDSVINALEKNDLVAALAEWRYEFYTDKGTGALVFSYFRGEKWGDDAQLWEALAPAIDTGCHIEYRGEDGHHWRYLFTDGKVKEQNGTIIWE